MHSSAERARARRRALACASAGALLLALSSRALAAPTVDTAQPSYDENSPPLQQNPIVFDGGTFEPTTNYTTSKLVTLDAPGGTVDATNGYAVFNGSISGPGGLTIKGADVNNVFLGAPNSYGGGTTIDVGGILGATSLASIPGDVLDNGLLQLQPGAPATYSGVVSGSGEVQVASHSLTLTGDNTDSGVLFGAFTTVQIGSGGAHGAWNGDVLLENGNVTFDRSGTVTFSGVISDFTSSLVGSLTQSGAGTLILTAASGYSNGTTIDSGSTLQLGDGTSGHDGIAGSGAIVDNGTLKFDYAGSQDFGNDLSGTGSVEVVAGTVVATSQSVVSGAVTIDSGATLQMGDGSGLAYLVSNSIVDNGALLVDQGAGHTLGLGNIVISGSGSVSVKSGGLSSSGVNTYSGLTTVDSGAAFSLSSSGAIALSSGLVDNGTFNIIATSTGTSIKSLSGAGAVTLGSKTLALTAAAGTFSGVISGTNGALTISGGTETLTGANTFTGVTTIDAGAILQLGDGVNNGTVTGAIHDLGTLKFDYSAAGGTFTGQLGGPGAVEIAGGKLIVVGPHSTSGTITIDSGATLQWGDGTNPGTLYDSSTGAVVDNGTLIFDYPSGVGPGGFSVSGTGGLEIKGGTYDDGGGLSYSGQTTIDPGAQFSLVGGGTLGNSSGVTDNGDFDISGATGGGSIKSLSGSGTVNLGLINTLTLTAAAGTFSGDISGGGGLTVSGGTETLTGVNGFTGLTTIDSGATLKLAGAGSIAQSADPLVIGTFDISGAAGDVSVISLSGSGHVVLGSNTLILTTAADTFSGHISGSGGLTIAGGSEVLTGFSTYSGATTIDSGATLSMEGGGAIGSSHVEDDGTLDISPNPTFYFGAIAGLSGSGQVHLGGNVLVLTDASDTFSGVISGSSAGGLWVQSGTETLTGVNTYQGATLIDGTLDLAGPGSIADAFLVEDNGVFDISGTTSGASIRALGGSGTVVLGAQTLTITDGSLAGSAIFLGAITGAGGLTIAGGSEGLAGVNTYTGATLIDPGATLFLGGSGSIADSSLVTDNGVLDISFEFAGASIRDLAGSGQVTLGGQTLTITHGAHTFSGVIAGSGGLTVAGGTEGLSGDDTYTGATTIDPGAVLKLVGSGSIAASSVVTDNGTFDISGVTGSAAAITTLSGSGAVLLGAKTLVIGLGSTTFAGDISGAGSLDINGGTQTLSGVNDYTGATGVGPGAVLALTGTGSISHSAVLFDNGVFDISGTTSGASIVSLGGHGSVVLGGQTLTITDAAHTFSGVISGGGGLTIAGGAETLGGVNLYSGATLVSSGASLILTGNGSVAGSSVVTDNGTFDISGASGGVSIKSLAGSGAVTLGANGLTLTAAANEFSGAISGAGGMTIAAGDEILTGTNPFIGGVTISTGAILQLGHGGSTGSVASGILDNGLLIFDLGSALTYGRVISGTGSVIIGGTGPVTFTASNTYAGGTTINAGARLNLGASGTSGSVAGNIADNGTLAFNRADTVVFGAVISGTGALIQAGSGTVILNGVNTVSGQTTVAAGTLEVGDASHMGAVLDSHLGGVLVNSGGTLAGHGTINGGVTNNGVTSPGGTIGTLTVGSYTQGSGGALNIEVSPTAASLLKVIGAASLAGTLNLNFDAGAYTPQIYTILTASSVTGTFSTVNRTGNPAGMVYGVGYGSGAVFLVGEPLANAEVYGEVSKATLDRAQSFASMVEDSFGAAVCASGANVPHTDDCNGMRAWAQVIGSSDHVNATSSGAAFTNKGAGALGGIDRRWGQGMTLGLAFGYTENNLRISAAPASASGRSYFLAGYGRASAGLLQLDGQGFWMKTDWPLRRGVTGVGTASSNPNGDSEGFLAQLSAPLGTSGLRPYARFTYAHFARDAVSETGVGMLGFDIRAGAADAAVGEAGFIFDPASVSLGQAKVFPTLRLGVQQDFSSRSIPIAGNLGGLAGTDFTTNYVKPGRTTGVVDAAIKARLAPNFDLTADVRGRFGSGQSEAAASIGGVVRF